MVPIALDSIGAGPAPCRGSLIFRLPEGEEIAIAVSLAQARTLAAEVHGLSGDRCSIYHLVQSVAQSGSRLQHIRLDIQQLLAYTNFRHKWVLIPP